MYRGTRVLGELVHRPGGVLLHVLEDVGVAPEGHRRVRVAEKRGISPDTALRLSRYFGMSEGYWINAQAHYEKEVAKDRGGEKIEREVRPRAPA